MGIEVDFLPVGNSNGDAIAVRYGNDLTGYTVHVVDGGYTDTSSTIVGHIRQYWSTNVVDHMVLSHADGDHAAGLIGVMEAMTVRHLWMNRPWLYVAETIHNFHGNYTEQGLREEIRRLNPHLVELERLAIAQGTVIHDAFTGAQIGAFTVLAPSRQRYVVTLHDFGRTPQSYAEDNASAGSVGGFLGEMLKALKRFVEDWTTELLEHHPPAVTASNESSVVQLAAVDGFTFLLTADAGPVGLTEAADFAELLGRLASPDFVQIPHHGSRRNVTPAVLDRWLGPPVMQGVIRGSAYCSVGSNKPAYPRNRVRNAFLRRGYGVYTTRNGWISHFRNTSPKPGSSTIASEPFAYTYEE